MPAVLQILEGLHEAESGGGELVPQTSQDLTAVAQAELERLKQAETAAELTRVRRCPFAALSLPFRCPCAAFP